ncbi:hypothetical protein F2Q69_00031807 [Brassica cretica]|uniref:Uncharacterized protein n=1 Tax=Brassica cretica TaxID=69181 RepID=A0A8S9S3D2_BRACR|nr:hypothetical protein F2Q69_00031807 [Brassica cretica]
MNTFCVEGELDRDWKQIDSDEELRYRGRDLPNLFSGARCRTKPALMSGLELSSEFFEFLVKEWSVAVFEESLMRAFSYGVRSYWGLSSIRWPLLTLEFDCLVWSLRSFGAVWM